MPPNAKRVFQGVVFDVYQWQQKMFDGSYATFEKLKRKDTVVIIPITKDGKILITRQEQPGKEPFLSLAGGQIDEGEGVFDAAKRELLEETGHEAYKWKLWMAHQPYSKIEWALYFFVAQDCIKIIDQELDPGERIVVEKVSFEDFTDVAVDEKFIDQEIKFKFLEAKADPQKMNELKKLFLE